MKLPKLIAADIDGTLVNDDGEMMELTRSALKILHKHGFHPVGQTGPMGKPYPVHQHIQSPLSLFL